MSDSFRRCEKWSNCCKSAIHKRLFITGVIQTNGCHFFSSCLLIILTFPIFTSFRNCGRDSERLRCPSNRDDRYKIGQARGDVVWSQWSSVGLSIRRKQVFGYHGGAVLDIYDALHTVGGIDHVLVRHEQAAVHMADGTARATGDVGVVLVTSGPGSDQCDYRKLLRPIVPFRW